MCDFGLQVELPPADLSTPGALGQTMQLLKDVLACHDASVVAIDDKKQDFKQVLIRFYQYTNRMHPVQKDTLNLIICYSSFFLLTIRFLHVNFRYLFHIDKIYVSCLQIHVHDHAIFIY